MSLIDTLAPNGAAPTAPSPGGGSGLLAAIPSQLKGTAPAASGSMFDTMIPNAFGTTSQSTPSVLPQGQGSFTDLLKGIVQAVPRDVATFGVSLGQADANIYSTIAKQLNLPGQDLGTKSVGISIPTGNMSWLLGDKPIEGFADQASKTIDSINASPFAQKTGLSKFSIPLAIAATVVPPSFDFAGLGGEKSALEALARSTSEVEIAGIGQRIGIQQDLLPSFSKAIAGESTTNGVKDIIDNFAHVQATTKFSDIAATRAADEAVTNTPAIEAGAPVRPSTTLPATMRPVEADAINYLTKNESSLVDQYIKDNGNVINTDNARELFPAYQADRTLSAAVHEPASYLAKQVYDKMLETEAGKGNNTVLFTMGGTGAGKTSAIKAMENVAEYPIVYDTNLNKTASAVSKIEKALAAGYDVKIAYVHNDIATSLENALQRAERMRNELGTGRTVPLDEHINTHTGAQQTFGQLLGRYGEHPKVEFGLLDNAGNSVRRVDNPFDFLTKNAYNSNHEAALKEHLTEQIKNARDTGRISEQTAKGFLGDKTPLHGLDGSGATKGAGVGADAERKLAESGIKPDVNPDSPATIEKKVVAQTFREDKLNLTPEESEGLTARLKALGLDTRGVRTFGEMQEAAQALGTDIKGLLKETKANRITDSEIVGLRELINHNSQLEVDLQKQLLEKPGDIDLERKLRIANVQIDEALKKLVKGGTEAGRAVAAFRIVASRDMAPASWFERAQRVLDNAPLTNEHKAAILDLIHKSDRQGLAEYVSMLRSPTFAEKAVTLWKAGLLTSFTTHLANIGGNITMGLLSEASNVAATTLDVLASIITHERTTTTGIGPIIARAKGAAAGVKDAAHYMRTGTYTEELLTKYDLPKGPTFKNKILNGYTNAVFRSLGAEDIVFRQAALSASMERQAIVIAKNEGLVGDAAKARIGALLKEPTNGMVMEAINASEYETFNNDNVLADFISRGKAAVRGKGIAGQTLYTAAEIIAPFTRTPTNVAARIADYSPAGFIKAMVRFANPVTRSQKNLVDDLGRAITGSGVMAFGAYLYQKGIMTGNAPTNPGELATFQAQGKQANSIYLAGRWWNMNRLSPFGNLLGLGAEFETLAQDQSGLPLALSTTVAGIQQLTQQTFLQGVSGALQAVNDPTQSAQTYFNSTASSVIPSVIGRVASTIDPTKRVPDGVLQSIQAKLPFLSESLPAKRDVFGNVVQVTGGRLNLIDPFASTKGVDDPVLDEASRLGISINQPSKTVANGKYTNKEYSAVQLIRGKILHDSLVALNSSDAYNKATNAGKAKIFQSTINDVNQAVNDQVYPALMIQRYGLPADTNPDLLKSLLTTLNAEPTFKQGSIDWQARVLEKLLTAAKQ